MLETIREYGLERLAESGEEETFRTRHAEEFARLAEAAYAHRGEAEAEWSPRLDRDHDDLRSALDWLRAHESGRGARARRRARLVLVHARVSGRGRRAVTGGTRCVDCERPSPRAGAHGVRLARRPNRDRRGRPSTARGGSRSLDGARRPGRNRGRARSARLAPRVRRRRRRRLACGLRGVAFDPAGARRPCRRDPSARRRVPGAGRTREVERAETLSHELLERGETTSARSTSQSTTWRTAR